MAFTHKRVQPQVIEGSSTDVNSLMFSHGKGLIQEHTYHAQRLLERVPCFDYLSQPGSGLDVGLIRALSAHPL